MILTAESVRWLRAAVGQVLGSADLDLRGQDARHGSRPLPIRAQIGGDDHDWNSRDWSAIGDAARHHNLEPLLFDLVDRGVVTAPAGTREIWEAQYYRNQIFNHSLFEILGALLAAAAGKAVRIIALKGPVSIARRLGDPGLRVMVDMDLLCRQADLAVLAEIAIGLGFRAVGENSIYHLAFQHPGRGIGLEFHFDLYEVLAERHKFIEEVTSGAERLDVDSVSILAPPVPAEIVLQLAHLLNHDYRVDLRHWFDFALALTAFTEAKSRDGEFHRELLRLLRLTDLEPEYLEASAIVSGLFGVDLGPRARRREPASLAGIEAGLLDLRDDRALLAGARVHARWWARARYAARLLAPSPRRWRALAVAEGSGIGMALLRHLSRAIGRFRAKVERLDPSAAPADSPRARLFRRRSRSS